MSHLKIQQAPTSWPLPRKAKVFVTRQSPGPHSLATSIPLNIVLRDILQVTTTTRETKKVLNAGMVLVDNKARKDCHFPVGFMDVLSVPQIKKSHVALYNQQGSFILHEVSEEEARAKRCKIVNKSLLKGKRTQLNLYDGKNILVDKDSYKVGDSVIINLDNFTIQKHLKFEKGALIFLTRGKHVGKIGTLEEIKQFRSIEEDRIVIKTKEGDHIETLKSYAFVIDKPIENEN